MTISAVPGGFLTTLGIGSGCSSKAWSSADGSTWTCIDDPAFAGFAVTGAASSPSAELLVGYNAAEPDATGTTTWTRAAP